MENFLKIDKRVYPSIRDLKAVFFKLVQCQPRQNHEIGPIVVERVHFKHT